MLKLVKLLYKALTNKAKASELYELALMLRWIEPADKI